MNKVIIIGGGASGIMAAISAAQRGREVLIIERNEKLGKKLFITGKGRCNVTSNKDVEEIIKNIPGNGIFMYSSLYTFTNFDLMKMIEARGVKLKVERGERVFPESDKSSDIIKCFEGYLRDNHVDIMLNTRVIEILLQHESIIGVRVNDGRIIQGSSVIIATGGKSYPVTGSSGDGYEFAEKLGHTIVELRPSLVPLVAKEMWIKDLMGLSLKNVSLSVKSNNKVVYSEFGEMLFTHFGISGPIVLSASRRVVDFLPGEVEVNIDMKPALDFNELDRRILKDFEKNINKLFKNALNELLPQKMIPIIIELSGINQDKVVNIISREERQRLVKLIKEFKIIIIGTRSVEEAIITRGGVNVKEIDPSTMESKLVKGLFIIGEALDVDGLTGGFNLQIAFSTGYCAGLNC